MLNYESRASFRLAHTTTKYWPLMADSTLSNSRNILTASSSRTSAIWKEMCAFVYRLYRFIDALTSQVAILFSHLENDTFNHFAVFLALFFRLSLQIFVHLSSAHHVLQDKGRRK